MVDLTSVNDVTLDGGLDESSKETPKACCSCLPRILGGLLRRTNRRASKSDPNTDADDDAESSRQQRSGRCNNNNARPFSEQATTASTGSHETVSACQLDEVKSPSSACSQHRWSTMTCDSGTSQQAVVVVGSDPATYQNLPLRLGNYGRSPRTHRKSVPAEHGLLSRLRGCANRRRSSSSCCIGTRPQGDQQLWSPAMVGSLYVFEGDKVPALMEVFTSASSLDFGEINYWLSAWFASKEAQNPIDPQFVPMVFHVTDLGNDTHQGNSPAGNAKFTQRRLAYEKSWDFEGTHSEERYSGYGSCLIINGECANMDEVFRMQEAGMSVAVRSRSPGVLKILLADESTALITFQPLPQCRHMIGQLVANVALVGCGGQCSARGHDSSGAHTHHSTVLDTVQVQLEKREENAYHVAGLNMSLPDAANFRLPGIVSHGLVVWVTHGYVDSTPIAVGYCGLKPP